MTEAYLDIAQYVNFCIFKPILMGKNSKKKKFEIS